eukprot:4743299-Amphidinium_carterae.2
MDIEVMALLGIFTESIMCAVYMQDDMSTRGKRGGCQLPKSVDFCYTVSTTDAKFFQCSGEHITLQAGSSPAGRNGSNTEQRHKRVMSACLKLPCLLGIICLANTAVADARRQAVFARV